MAALAHPEGGEIDQIAQLIGEIRRNPIGRSIVSAWNVGDLPSMKARALPRAFQFTWRKDVSCQLYQRSAEHFSRRAFNIASYALLTHMVAQQTILHG